MGASNIGPAKTGAAGPVPPALGRLSSIGRDCRVKYNFNSEDMSVAFSDSLTFCDQYDTFFIQIRSVEAELRA